MAIMKMRMVNIVGPIEEFAHIALQYVAESNIHLENVFTVFDNVKGMYAFNEDSKAVDVEKQAVSLIELAHIDEIEVMRAQGYQSYIQQAPNNLECISNGLEAVRQSIVSLAAEKEHMHEKLKEYEELRKQLRPIEKADVDLNALYTFEFIKFRFGKMPVKGYRILNEYLKDLDAFFLKTSEDEEYAWGVYFAPESEEEKVDAVFASLYFERIRISDNVHGTPRQSLDYLDQRETYRKERIAQLEEEISQLLACQKDFIVYAKEYSRKLIKLQEVKKYAGHTKESFYIVGWMTNRDADKLEQSMEGEQDIVFLKEYPENISRLSPPTKLRNLMIFRPFELFVKMYGLPGYHEFDPTWIFAISYFIMFGAMFGDLGQGFLLCIGGFLFAKIKKSKMGAIIGMVGISSMIFGVAYGSVFGNEELIHGYNPMEHIMDVLMFAVYFGVGIILLVMLLNIIIGIKNRDVRKALFSQNGIAGLVFYGVTVLTVISLMFSGGAVSPIAIAVIIGMLLLIMLQEPLAHLLERRKSWMPQKKGMFLLESFFELFEIIVSFISNTLSFLRIGAFALNHVGMMGVVKILATMMGGGNENIVVIILGNLLVMALEGLVVGVQALRLGFVEMFSRFYTGDGREFRSLNENKE